MTRRRGFSLLECGIAGAVLAVMIGVCLQFLTAVASQRRAMRWRETAVREAANTMERLAARPWDGLTAEATTDIKLSPEAQEQLPGGQLKIEVTPVTGEPAAKKITVNVAWTPQEGLDPQTVRLAAWRHRRP